MQNKHVWDALEAIQESNGDDSLPDGLECGSEVSARVQQVLQDICNATPALFQCCAAAGALQLFTVSQARKNIFGSVGLLASVQLCVSSSTVANVVHAMLIKSEMKARGELAYLQA